MTADKQMFLDFYSEVSVTQEVPFMVYIGAEWCGTCKMIKPIIKKIADAGDVVVEELDADNLGLQLGIRGIPHCFVFEKGELTCEGHPAHCLKTIKLI